MNNTTKTIGTLAIGAVLALGGQAIIPDTIAAPVITVSDDGKNPVDVQKVIIKTTETKAVVTTDFEGTLSDIKNEILPRLYAERDRINAEIAKYEALQEKVTTEIQKLPVRDNSLTK